MLGVTSVVPLKWLALSWEQFCIFHTLAFKSVHEAARGHLGGWITGASGNCREAIWDEKLLITKCLLAGEGALYQAHTPTPSFESARNFVSYVLPFNFQWW